MIITNIGTAVVLFPALRKYSEAAALDYVAARIVECVFIAVGILSVLTVVTLRQTAGAGSWTSKRPELAFRNPGLRGVEPFAGFGVRRPVFGGRHLDAGKQVAGNFPAPIGACIRTGRPQSLTGNSDTSTHRRDQQCRHWESSEADTSDQQLRGSPSPPE